MSLIRFQSQGPSFASWPTFSRWANLSSELDRIFDRAVGQPSATPAAPALDLFENKDAYLVTLELPGLKAEQITLNFHDGALTVSGEFPLAQNEQGTSARRERVAGKFSRSLQVPGHVNGGAVSATYKDGILTVTLPKSDEAKPRKIEVGLN